MKAKTKIIGLMLAVLLSFPALAAAQIEFEEQGKLVAIQRTPISVAATGTAFTITIKGYNRITRYVLEVPNYTTGTPTTTLSFLKGDVTLFTGAALAENTNYSVPMDLEIYGQITAKLTLSDVSGGATTVYLSLYGEGGI